MKRISYSLFFVLAMSSTLFANGPSLQYGPPFTSEGNFDHPFGLAIDESSQTVVVADTGRRSFKIAPISSILLGGSTHYSEWGYVANASSSSALIDPQAAAVAPNGDVYVLSTLHKRVKRYIRQGQQYVRDPNFDSAPSRMIDGVEISFPRDLAFGPQGTLYLLDSGNNRILKATGPQSKPWTLERQDLTWSNPYGFVVISTGAFFIADTGNHRIVKIHNGVSTSYGRFGQGRGELRYPRDVAVDQWGRIYVADTFNHRIQVLASDGRYLTSMGQAPDVGSLQKIVVDQQDRVFALDSDNNRVLAFMGAGTPAPFDPFIRDYPGDPGDEPTPSHFVIGSPDILVRHQPDVSLSTGLANGEFIQRFEQPYFDRPNYVYLKISNKGTQAATRNIVKLFWVDPGTQQRFPDNWNESGFFQTYVDSTTNQPGNGFLVSSIDPGQSKVVGPFIWFPPEPASTVGRDGRLTLAVRIINPYDSPPAGDSRTIVRDSNNVTEKSVTVVEGPFPTGPQNTLIVFAHFPDISTITDRPMLRARANEMATWIETVSYGQASVHFLERGPVALTLPTTAYNGSINSMVIDLVKDALAPLLRAEPTLLEGQGPGREIGRVIIMSNVGNDIIDFSLSQPWPYRMNGKTFPLTASVFHRDVSTASLSHGLAHQMGLKDLYPYWNVALPRPTASLWDNMDQPFNGAHPLVWSKEQAQWITKSSATILYIPRPRPGQTWSSSGSGIPLRHQVTASSGGIVGIALGLTNGITAFTDETAFYYVEARTNTAPRAGYDSVVPQSGVLVYYANKLIPQGQGPVLMRDHRPGGTLNDAAIPVGGAETIGPAGITLRVNAGTSGSDYNIGVTYTPPATDYDVYFNPGNPAWMSPDIWVDNQADGYDADQNLVPQDRGNEAIAGEINRLYARVHNRGPAIAYDVEVVFSISEPYHTVGDVASFEEIRSVFISTIGAGSYEECYVNWVPRPGVDPHTCVRVEVRRLISDTQSVNNNAQKNLKVNHSVHGSPYTPVTFPFQVKASTSIREPQLVYFRADGIPESWSWSFDQEKVLLAPGQQGNSVLRLQPPDTAPDCTEHDIRVTAWTPDGDTLIQMGGATARVQLQRKTDLQLVTKIAPCDPKKMAQFMEIHTRVSHDPSICVGLVSGGCTTPPLPNQTIVLRYEGPDGNPVYHTVMTDSNGCYEDFFVTPFGGDWAVTANLPGDPCFGPATATIRHSVPGVGVHVPADDGILDPDKTWSVSGFSYDIKGETLFPDGKPTVSDLCKTECVKETLKLSLFSAQKKSGWPESGNMTIRLNLGWRDINLQWGSQNGVFEWTAGDNNIIGSAQGLMNRGTRHDPLSGSEGTPLKYHREIYLDGLVVKGPSKGKVVRAVVSISDQNGIAGSLEGNLAWDCSLSEKIISKKIDDLKTALNDQSKLTCEMGARCLTAFAKEGKGTLIKQRRGISRDCDKKKTQTITIVSSLRAKIQSISSIEGPRPPWIFTSMLVDEFVERFENGENGENGRGLFGGDLTLTARDGTTLSGRLDGLTNIGTHRFPRAQAVENSLEKGQLEGIFSGEIIKGKKLGARVEGHVVIKKKLDTGRRMDFIVVLDGWVIQDKAIEKGQSNIIDINPRDEEAKPEKSWDSRIHLDRVIEERTKEIPMNILKQWKKIHGKSATPEEKWNLINVYRQFSEWDISNNGILDSQEFISKYDLRIGKLGKGNTVERRPEKRSDIVIPKKEPSEIEQQLRTQEFQKMDTDKNETVDFFEFSDWASEQIRILVK